MNAHTKTLLFLAAVMLVAPSASGCTSIESGQPTTSEAQTADADDASKDAVANSATKFEIVSALKPLARFIVTFTDTDYLPESEDVDFASVYAAIMTNWGDVQQARQDWESFLSSHDLTQTDVPSLPAEIAAYNQGLDVWMAHQEEGLGLWSDCLKSDPSQFAMLLCTTAELDMDKEQQVLDAYTTPLKSLMTSLGVLR